MKNNTFKKLINEIVSEVMSGMEAFTPDQIDALKEMGFMRMKFPVPEIVDGMNAEDALHGEHLEFFGFKWDEAKKAYTRKYKTDNDILFEESVVFSPSRSPKPILFIRTVSNALSGQGEQTRFSDFSEYEKLENVLENLGVYDDQTIHGQEPSTPDSDVPNPSPTEV